MEAILLYCTSLIIRIDCQGSNHSDSLLDGDCDRPHDCLLVLWIYQDPCPVDVTRSLLLGHVPVLVLEGQALGPGLQAVGHVDQGEDLQYIICSGFSRNEGARCKIVLVSGWLAQN